MSSRSLFVPSDLVPGNGTASDLRHYVGGNAEVQAREHNVLSSELVGFCKWLMTLKGRSGFIVRTTSNTIVVSLTLDSEVKPLKLSAGKDPESDSSATSSTAGSQSIRR